jgi:hypothetical protein
MIDEKGLLERYLWILCQDFAVKREPGLIYKPYEKKIGLSGIYDVKAESIILYTPNYRTLIHEFIHHLQYEQYGYDYEKYIKDRRKDIHRPYFKRKFEIEAHKMEHVLSGIYDQVFSRGFLAEPIGNELLGTELVGYTISHSILGKLILEQIINRINEITDTTDYTKFIDVSITSEFAYNEYESMGYTLKYAVRAYFLQWYIPELNKLNREINAIKRRITKCRKMAKSYFELAYRGNPVEISEIFDLQSAFLDILYMSDRLEMHIKEVFRK